MRNIDDKSKEYQEGYWDGHNDATSIAGWFYDPNGMDWNIGAWRCDHCGYRNSSLPNVESINPYMWAGSKYCAKCGRRMLPDGEE